MAQKPLIFNALKVSKALHFSPVAAHPVTGLSPPLLISAIEAIFGPVGFGDKQDTTNSAWPHLVTVEQGGAQVCVQSISYSLLCRWFRAAVLPLDGILYAALFPQGGMKVCVECKFLLRPGSNRAKYCPACAAKVHRRQKSASERRRRASGVDN